jgi:hypothetical protein
MRRSLRRGLALLPLLLFALAAPSPAAAQRDNDDLQSTFRAVANAWARQDPSVVVRHIAPGGVSIDASDGPMGPMGERQAIAMLRRIFSAGQTVSVQTGMLERVGGQPPRAFGSITWVTRPEGTQVPVRRTVYFGLELTSAGWKVSEIRLIP